jgi:hypothetical protein
MIEPGYIRRVASTLIWHWGPHVLELDALGGWLVVGTGEGELVGELVVGAGEEEEVVPGVELGLAVVVRSTVVTIVEMIVLAGRVVVTVDVWPGNVVKLVIIWVTVPPGKVDKDVIVSVTGGRVMMLVIVSAGSVKVVTIVDNWVVTCVSVAVWVGPVMVCVGPVISIVDVSVRVVGITVGTRLVTVDPERVVVTVAVVEI